MHCTGCTCLVFFLRRFLDQREIPDANDRLTHKGSEFEFDLGFHLK